MKKQLKRAIVGMSLLAGLGLVAGCGSQDNVGYIDMQQVLQKSVKAQEIGQKMQDRQAALQQKLAKMQEAGATEAEMVKAQMEAMQEMQAISAASQKEFQNYIETESQAVAKEQGVSVVLAKQAVLSGGKDLTEPFLKHINGGKTAEAAKPADDKKDVKDTKDAKDAKSGDGQGAADAKQGAAKEESK